MICFLKRKKKKIVIIREPTPVSFLRGCITERRRIQSFGKFIFVVHTKSMYTSCSQENCQLFLELMNSTDSQMVNCYNAEFL